MNKGGKILVVSFQSLTATSGQGMARLGHALSKELHKRGLLKSFVVNSKGKFDTPFPSEPVSFFSRYYLFILNKINSFYNFQTHGFRFIQELLFDFFCAMKLNKSISILFVTQPYLKRTFKKAKSLGITTILLSGTPEDDYIYDIVSEENRKLGSKEIDAYTYDRRNRYFKESMKNLDVAIGFFPTVYKTYKESTAFKGEAVNMTGHMTPDFPFYDVKNKKKTGGKFVVGFMSYVVVLKGLQYLLEAWEEIITEHNLPDIELVVGGPLNPVMHDYIEEHYDNVKQVRFAGHVHNIAAFMQELDLFVVPSLVDGGPMAALEAAHYAVPVLITDNAGSSELISRGDGGGYIVPIRDAKAIKESILWAYHHREENAQKGLNAKQNLTDYNFDEYIVHLSDYLEKMLND
ncbi:MAG: glycosyltransferase family 4 protein [Chitinophagaceae bacterium]|nr:glycosyltransferase family 4 protein [Chitinophagaceae bacterium]